MSEIPVDIMGSAERCLTQTQWNPETVRAIAQAILAERKRCAEIASRYDCSISEYPSEVVRQYYEAGVDDAGGGIKMLILSPTAQENE